MTTSALVKLVTRQKASGAYFTPDDAVRSLVAWAVRSPKIDRMLDPSCGDGRFLACHPNPVHAVGVEQDADSFGVASERNPRATVYHNDFFTWATTRASASTRFDCAAGNPPFIRYQRFTGQVRQNALFLCRTHGVDFSALASSWAPFLVATATLLKPGGRMAFVVPAEIGHAPYARPLLEYFANNFDHVQIVAVRHKIFPDLSEDCWLLYADGFGGSTDHFILSPLDSFGYMPRPPALGVRISLDEWEQWNHRLRPFLLSAEVRAMYRELTGGRDTIRLGDAARVGIGYVTGDNDFFHLRPSEAEAANIPFTFLKETVRNGRVLPPRAVTRATVDSWIDRDEPVYLLHLTGPEKNLPRAVKRYLDTSEGEKARATYKCRNRSPWYTVPDVTVPDAFLAYMSGDGPTLVANHARCVCTNSLHAVRLTNGLTVKALQQAWNDPFTTLSCEVEGHPLGGGMLKLEPREAGRIALMIGRESTRCERAIAREGVETMRKWRHMTN